jgi:LacI family transcriptional regulator
MSTDRKKRVTQNDVARRANVSNAVVSYVINGGPRPTSDDTRGRVLRAIAELGYQLDASARGLRGGRNQAVGFVLQDVEPLKAFRSSFSAQLLTGIASELKARNYFLTFLPLEVDEQLAQLVQLLHSNRLDGVIVRLMQDAPATDPILEAVTAANIPCVCVERPGAHRFGFRSVFVDDERGGYAATRYLIEQGHRRIAHLGGDWRYAVTAQRMAGYRRALTEFGLPADELLIGGGTWDRETGLNSSRHFLELAEPPTAIFAANDSLASGALAALQERGLRVRDDVAIIGYDDDELVVERTSPPLTTMRLPSMQMGRRAAEFIVRAIETGQQRRETEDILPAELIQRDTA